MGPGLRQGLCSRDTSPSSCERLILSTKNDGQKEKAIQSGEDEEFSKDLPHKHGCDHTNRYDDNLYAQSPPFPFSVFGRPLLPRVFLARGVYSGLRIWNHLGWWRLMARNGEGSVSEH